jgi:hypothetical protein
MDATAATARINLYCPTADDPALTEDEIALLLAMAAVVDEEDLEPAEEGYTPTYSVLGCLRAAREGWVAKRGKIVGRFDFTTDGQTFRRSQVLDHVDGQIDRLNRKINHAVSLGEPPC